MVFKGKEVPRRCIGGALMMNVDKTMNAVTREVLKLFEHVRDHVPGQLVVVPDEHADVSVDVVRRGLAMGFSWLAVGEHVFMDAGRRHDGAVEFTVHATIDGPDAEFVPVDDRHLVLNVRVPNDRAEMLAVYDGILNLFSNGLRARLSEQLGVKVAYN